MIKNTCRSILVYSCRMLVYLDSIKVTLQFLERHGVCDLVASGGSHFVGQIPQSRVCRMVAYLDTIRMTLQSLERHGEYDSVAYGGPHSIVEICRCATPLSHSTCVFILFTCHPSFENLSSLHVTLCLSRVELRQRARMQELEPESLGQELGPENSSERARTGGLE